MNTVTSITSTVDRIWTCCSMDCEELGGHTSEHIICDRCGAHVHKRIFDVHRKHSDGTVDHLSVGSECFKDVMGYSWKKAHDKALEVHAYILRLVNGWNVKRQFVKDSNAIKKIDHLMIYPGRLPELTVPKYKHGDRIRYGSVTVRPPYGFSATVARAGEDIGLWRLEGGRYIMDVSE